MFVIRILEKEKHYTKKVNQTYKGHFRIQEQENIKVQ